MNDLEKRALRRETRDSEEMRRLRYMSDSAFTELLQSAMNARVKLGLLLGGTVGAAIGLAIDYQAQNEALYGTALGATAGGVLGFLVSLVFVQERYDSLTQKMDSITEQRERIRTPKKVPRRHFADDTEI